MRDIFADLAGPTGNDPVERARAHARRALPKRFYDSVDVEEGAGGFRLLLDGRPVQTPARRPLAVPGRSVAAALAEEWRRQGEVIDPATMPMTRLVHTALDGVADEPGAVADEIAGYAASDLLAYRADGPARLVARQAETWDPIVAAAERRLGVRIRLAIGVMPIAQDPALVAAVRATLPADPFALTALHTLTSIAGSVLIALAVADGSLDADRGWLAGHLDEDWNAELWGEDADARRRAAGRRAEFDAAVIMLRGG